MRVVLLLTFLFVNVPINGSPLPADINEMFKWQFPKVGSPHIIGGQEVKKPIPYQVLLSTASIENPYEYFCGGSLITPEFILTAAHCTETYHTSYFKRHGVSATLGSLDIKKFDPATAFKSIIQNYTVHPQRDTFTRAHDIALLMMENPAPINNVNIGTIPVGYTPPEVGQKCLISGWGITDLETPSNSEKLRSAIVPIVSREDCEKKYKEFGREITSDMICAGKKEGVDACRGDSGGPIACDGRLAGVISWGWSCALPEVPGVYSSIAHHTKWIHEAMKSLKENFAANSPESL